MDLSRIIIMVRRKDGSPFSINNGYHQSLMTRKTASPAQLEAEYLRLLESGYIEMTPAQVQRLPVIIKPLS